MTDFAWPYQIAADGRTALAESEDRHLRDLIEQVLFTSPGERVNRPDFGSGLLGLVFEPAADALVATLEFTVQAALQRWLGERIEVGGVEVGLEDSTLRVTVTWRRRTDSRQQVSTFEREVGG